VGDAVSSGPALEVRQLLFAYPDGTQALFGIDLTIERGERVALLGPNGAGKTTLVMHLNGIHVAQSGSISVGGLPVTKEHFKEIRRRVGIVFQDPDDQLFMPTVREDVGFGPSPRCWRWSPRSWSWTSPRRTWTRPGGESSRRSCGRSRSRC
jgi:cobalt/nickel transport system ATP-binding protein